MSRVWSPGNSSRNASTSRVTVATEFLEKSPTVNADEVSLSSGRLFLPDPYGVTLPLFIGKPLDPVSDHHSSTHV